MIFHIDMDAFFAAIEIVQNPALRGLPVIIGGNPDERGVVSTCSYEARKFGVRSAMPLSEAKKRCPQGVFVQGDYSRYGEISREIMKIFRETTPYVQVMSIDEAYLDVTHLLDKRTTPKKLAQAVHRKVYEATKLTCSIGIASNKMMAKIASGHNKPNGLCFIPPGTEASFLAPLPIGVIPGIGKTSVEHLLAEGIQTVGDLQGHTAEQLVERFGSWGQQLYELSRGMDERPVRWLPRAPKSISEEKTFNEDSSDAALLRQTLEDLCEEATERLHRKKMRAGGVGIKLRDRQFRTFTRSRKFFTHTTSPGILLQEVRELFDLYYPEGMVVRLVGVTLERLTKREWQPTLWNWEEDTPHATSTPP